jgi:hypothetical protein
MTHATERDLGRQTCLQLFRLLPILGEGVDSRCVDGTGTHDIDADLPFLELIGPCAGEGADRRLGCAIDAKRRHSFDGNDRGVEHDGPAIGYKWKGFLHREEDAFNIRVEGLVKMLFGYLFDGGELAASSIGKQDIDMAMLLLDLCVELIEVCEVAGVGLDTGRTGPDLFKASSSTSLRRPVMMTFAPSETKRFAVARPIPLVPPVTSAIFPSSFFDMRFSFLMPSDRGPFGSFLS